MRDDAHLSTRTTKFLIGMASLQEFPNSTSDLSGSTNPSGSKTLPIGPSTPRKSKRSDSEHGTAGKMKKAPVFRNAIALGLIVGCVGSVASANMWKSDPVARDGASIPGEILIPFHRTLQSDEPQKHLRVLKHMIWQKTRPAQRHREDRRKLRVG